jgi:hypothetical protein
MRNTTCPILASVAFTLAFTCIGGLALTTYAPAHDALPTTQPIQATVSPPAPRTLPQILRTCDAIGEATLVVTSARDKGIPREKILRWIRESQVIQQNEEPLRTIVRDMYAQLVQIVYLYPEVDGYTVQQHAVVGCLHGLMSP